jgi:exodeoxyribonuclease III
MKIVSWNINSLRKRQDRLLAWLAETQPDVVCLQETKCTDEQFPELAVRAAGYRSAFHGQKSYNGVAILSRSALQDVRASLCDEEEGSAGARHRGDRGLDPDLFHLRAERADGWFARL